MNMNESDTESGTAGTDNLRDLGRALSAARKRGTAICKVCGKEIPNATSRRQYCSPLCKLRDHRARNKQAPSGNTQGPRRTEQSTTKQGKQAGAAVGTLRVARDGSTDYTALIVGTVETSSGCRVIRCPVCRQAGLLVSHDGDSYALHGDYIVWIGKSQFRLSPYASWYNRLGACRLPDAPTSKKHQERRDIDKHSYRAETGGKSGRAASHAVT